MASALSASSGLSAVSASLASVVSHSGLIDLIGLIGLSDLGMISLVGLLASSARQLIVFFGLNCLKGKGFEIEMKQSQHDLFWRERWLWCVRRVFSSLAGLNSVFEKALQNAIQLFLDRIPQMTKYCIMRECENILHGFLYVFDLAFVILKGIYGFKFPKRFLAISSRDLTSSLLFCQS